MPTTSTRRQDERLVTMIRMRGIGITSGQIAEHFGLTESGVRAMCERVRKADIEESGEPVEAVKAAYWGYVEPVGNHK